MVLKLPGFRWNVHWKKEVRAQRGFGCITYKMVVLVSRMYWTLTSLLSWSSKVILLLWRFVTKSSKLLLTYRNKKSIIIKKLSVNSGLLPLYLSAFLSRELEQHSIGKELTCITQHNTGQVQDLTHQDQTQERKKKHNQPLTQTNTKPLLPLYGWVVRIPAAHKGPKPEWISFCKFIQVNLC